MNQKKIPTRNLHHFLDPKFNGVDDRRQYYYYCCCLHPSALRRQVALRTPAMSESTAASSVNTAGLLENIVDLSASRPATMVNNLDFQENI